MVTLSEYDNTEIEKKIALEISLNFYDNLSDYYKLQMPYSYSSLYPGLFNPCGFMYDFLQVSDYDSDSVYDSAYDSD